MNTPPTLAIQAGRDSDGALPNAASNPAHPSDGPRPSPVPAPAAHAAERGGTPPTQTPAPEGSGGAAPRLGRTARLLRHLDRIEHSVRRVRAALTAPARDAARHEPTQP